MIFLPAPIIYSTSSACSADDPILPFYCLLLAFMIFFYGSSFFIGLAESTTPDDTLSSVKYFDTIAKRIFFTFALGLIIGQFLFKKRGN